MNEEVFYHEHGSWDERIRIEIAELKTKMKWTAYILGGLTGLSLFFGRGGVMTAAFLFATLVFAEFFMWLKLLYKKQLLKTKHGVIA